jgi:hypothetical protein
MASLIIDSLDPTDDWAHLDRRWNAFRDGNSRCQSGRVFDPNELGLSAKLIKRITKWLLEYENAHYYQFVDKTGNQRLDEEGISIAKQTREELPDAQVEYYSNAEMRKIVVIWLSGVATIAHKAIDRVSDRLRCGRSALAAGWYSPELVGRIGAEGIIRLYWRQSGGLRLRLQPALGCFNYTDRAFAGASVSSAGKLGFSVGPSRTCVAGLPNRGANVRSGSFDRD